MLRTSDPRKGNRWLLLTLVDEPCHARQVHRVAKQVREAGAAAGVLYAVRAVSDDALQASRMSGLASVFGMDVPSVMILDATTLLESRAAFLAQRPWDAPRKHA